MSSVITPPPAHRAGSVTIVNVEASPELWRSYRRQRLIDEARGKAASVVLEAAGIPHGERDPLHRALIRREMETGLRPSRAEVEADEAADAAQLASVPAAEPGSLEAIETDARARVVELEASRGRLALDALTDRDAAQELADVESELTAARAEIERVGLARGEQERRQVEAAEQAERQAAEQADADAAALQPAVREAAEAVDRAADVFAAAVAAYRDVRSEQAALMVAAGHGDGAAGVRAYRPAAVVDALAVALRARSVNLDGITHRHHPQPLAESEPAEGM